MTEQRIVRTALGAGKWFPGNRRELERMVADFIAQAEVPEIEGRLVGAIAPHAGYVYSGPVAGYTYRALLDNAAVQGPTETVVILGFSHRGGVRGIALMDGTAFATPLGSAPLDTDSARFLTAADPRIMIDYRPHLGEHSAENQVPFVQTALPGVPLVIALIGANDPGLIDTMVTALNQLSQRKKVIVIASSDMLHDADYDRVRRTDQATLKRVAAMDVSGVLHAWDHTEQVFCGIGPVVATMRFAQLQGCKKGTVLRYRNSGDDYPESRGQWVVGYGAVTFAA
jgi:AmmeMemoRadiSam system protein B